MYDLANLYSGIQGLARAQQPFSFFNVGSGALTVPLTIGGASTSVVSTIQNNLKQARLYSENLTIEQKLPFTMVLSVSYAGSRGEHLNQIGGELTPIPL